MHTMSEHTGGTGGLGVSVLPFDGMGLFEQQRPRFLFKMPKVVPNQKAKFETEELFRRLSRESEVRIILNNEFKLNFFFFFWSSFRSSQMIYISYIYINSFK